MRTQADDLNAVIYTCQKMKAEAVKEGNIQMWRKYENTENEARTILYNIR